MTGIAKAARRSALGDSDCRGLGVSGPRGIDANTNPPQSDEDIEVEELQRLKTIDEAQREEINELERRKKWHRRATLDEPDLARTTALMQASSADRQRKGGGGARGRRVPPGIKSGTKPTGSRPDRPILKRSVAVRLALRPEFAAAINVAQARSDLTVGALVDWDDVLIFVGQQFGFAITTLERHARGDMRGLLAVNVDRADGEPWVVRSSTRRRGTPSVFPFTGAAPKTVRMSLLNYDRLDLFKTPPPSSKMGKAEIDAARIDFALRIAADEARPITVRLARLHLEPPSIEDDARVLAGLTGLAFNAMCDRIPVELALIRHSALQMHAERRMASQIASTLQARDGRRLWSGLVVASLVGAFGV